MSAMSNFLENKFLDWFFRGQALGVTGASAAAASGPTTLYVGLFTAAPTDVGGGTEVSGGSYTRVAVTSSLANWSSTQTTGGTTASTGTAGLISNNTFITFPTPTLNWGTITSFGIFDSLTGGNLLLYGNLTFAKTVNSGDASPVYSPGALQIQVA